MSDTGNYKGKKPYKRRVQGYLKGRLLESFEVYSRDNEISESALIIESVREKLIRENAYRVGRISGHQGTG